MTEFGREYNSFRGSLASKEEVLRRAEICIVIENDFSTLSEKVFDAIYAGCVPIYVGPDVSHIEGLSDCLITVEPNARKIIEKLNGLTAMELQMRRDAIEVFTKSPNSMDFCAPPKVWSNVGRLIAGAILH